MAIEVLGQTNMNFWEGGQSMINFLKDSDGRVMVPIMLWFLGVPGLLVILLWFFVFKG
jgi:lipid-A-disaccharide synthase-like uncharacterized protein